MTRPRGTTRIVVTGLVLAALAVLAGAAPISLATFVDADATSASIATDTLDPPTALAAVGGASTSLTWTPTVDLYATGYEVLRSATSGSGFAVISSITPMTASAASDLPASGTWFYVLRSYVGSWTSVETAEVSAVVVPEVTTPFVPCGALSSSAEPGWGDGNGYESNAALACVDGTGFAIDAGSGTAARSTSCTNTANDAHRFGDFSLSVPLTALAVVGIEVRADLGLNNNGGTTSLCVQLSWDGGMSWTAPAAAPITGSAEATYLFGGVADTWGRTWSAGELSNAAFRVRVIDATTQNTKDFRLDYLAVRVAYSP
jgi:hypothetical protein